MSKRSTASTSSTPTAGSWADIAQLGQYILDQLGDDRRSENLLVHWVAHRLAEYMHAAEAATDPEERAASRDAAALLIARLWEARGGWPWGWPPQAVSKLFEGLRGGAAPFYDDEPVPLPPWLSSLGELDALAHEERTAWTYGALLELDGDQLRRALEAAPDNSSKDEDVEQIREQLRFVEQAQEWIAELAKPNEDATRRADRAQILARVFTDIDERRALLLERALKDARRGQRRKPARYARFAEPFARRRRLRAS